MDDDFDIDDDHDNQLNELNTKPLSGIKEGDDDLDHLKILGSRFNGKKDGKPKEVNIRKGVSIEKTLRMKEDGKGGFTQ